MFSIGFFLIGFGFKGIFFYYTYSLNYIPSLKKLCLEEFVIAFFFICLKPEES